MPHKDKGTQRLFAIISRWVMGTITHVRTQSPVVALTFDDGPHPEFTPRLLDILERHQAQATFFMIGQAARQYPEIVQRAALAGHTIGNHSWDHPSFPLVSRRERRRQIRACEQAIAPYGRRLFRPPYGHQDKASRLDVLFLGYQVVTWNVVAYDWLDYDANWIVKQVEAQLKPGSIVLFHDALYDSEKERYMDREPTLTAVNILLERLSNHFRFVTVPELLRYGPPQKHNWYRKGNVQWLNSLKRAEGEKRHYAKSYG